MSERKLATIRKINSLDPIVGADMIEVATLDGWKVVVRKGDFQLDELVCYIEVDSWVPTELAPFLSKDGNPHEYEGVKGERLRTVKLRGQISQGLILPLTKIPSDIEKVEGADLSSSLGILKWEAPIPASLAGVVKGNFPSFFPKTDQDRIQNFPEYFNGQFNGVPFEVTVKLDGSPCSVYYNNGEFGVCSRNLDLKETETNTFWSMVNKLNLREHLTKKGRNVVIQGELMGEGVQGNRENLKGHDLFCFDVWDIDKQRYLLTSERLEFLSGIQIKHVPILAVIPLFDRYPTMESMISYSGEGGSLNAPIREGLVFKSAELIHGKVLSFKAINPKFLLKYE